MEFTGFSLFVMQHSPPTALRKRNGMQILLNDEDRQTLGQAENSPAG